MEYAKAQHYAEAALLKPWEIEKMSPSPRGGESYTELTAFHKGILELCSQHS